MGKNTKYYQLKTPVMNRELILDNCVRLSQFYKNEFNIEGLKSEISIVADSFKGLLDTYSRILDYNGAPPRNLSRLYLTNDAFDKMINELYEMDITVEYLYLNQNCCFNYNGYYWEVLNEDAIKKAKLDAIIKSKNNQ